MGSVKNRTGVPVICLWVQGRAGLKCDQGTAGALGRGSVGFIPLGDLWSAVAQNSVGLLEPHCWHLPTLGPRVLLRFAVDNELLALLCLGQVPQGVFCSDSALKVVSPEGTKENSQKERIPTIFQALG